MAYDYLHAEMARTTVFEDATLTISEIRLTSIQLCRSRARDDRVEGRCKGRELVSRDIGAFRTRPWRKRHRQLDLEQIDVGPYYRN
jgi:hypothetical protein